MSVIDEIAAERKRQIEVEGYDAAHDDLHKYEELAQAAASYALAEANLGDAAESVWPWDMVEFRPTNARRNLIIAAALIVAEIERLDRAP